MNARPKLRSARAFTGKSWSAKNRTSPSGGRGRPDPRRVGDGGKLPHPDGRPTHTFRSYTAFFSGENLTVEDLTIENDAGPGAQVGQAVAAYVDTARAVFRRVKLLGNQDTLFCAPLPEKRAGERRLPRPPGAGTPPGQCPVLPQMRDRGGH